MFDKLDKKFINEMSSPEIRFNSLRKYRFFLILHLILALLLGGSGFALAYIQQWDVAVVLIVLTFANLILCLRCDGLCKILLAISYLDRETDAVAETVLSEIEENEEPVLGEHTEESTFPVAATAEIVTPSIEGVQEWFDLKEWKVEEGAVVTAGDVVAELENDDIIVEVEVMDSGQISLGVESGDKLNSGAILATLILTAQEEAA